MMRSGGSSRLSSAWRLSALVAVLLYVMVALGSAMDRFSAHHDGVASYVPAPFARAAKVRLAREAMLHGNTSRQVALARQALDRDPILTDTLSVLGMGVLQAGDAVQAQKVFAVADQLGMRDMATQSYMAHLALSQGRYDDAVHRLDIILRQKPELNRAPGLVPMIEANIPAQAALVRLLAARPPWLVTYASDVEGIAPEELGLRAVVLADLSQKGVRLGCDDIDTMVHELVQHGSSDDAHELWSLHCAGGGGLLWDGHLANLREQTNLRAEFRWRLITSGDLAVALQAAGQGDAQWVHITNSGVFPLPFIAQMVVLAPGTYRLRWASQAGDGRFSPLIAARLSCGEVSPVTAVGRGYGEVTVKIAANCPASEIRFEIAPNDQGVQFGDITLTKAID